MSAGSPRRVERARKKERAELDTRARDLRVVMSTAEGRRFVVWVIEDVCRSSSLSYAAGNPDATAHNEGRRAVGADIKAAVMSAARELFAQAAIESIDTWRQSPHERSSRPDSSNTAALDTDVSNDNDDGGT
jgi:hypothetical protein